MNYLVGTVIFNCLASPHHMGMGMGMGLGIGMSVGVEENSTYVLDTNYSTNITDSETENESGNVDDFSMVMGFGASFGIIGFIISVLALREKKNREYNDDIYLEPVSEIEKEDNNSHVLVVNENYNCEEGDGEHQYETICDTLYELAGENSVH
jgi:hypothetical protein